MLRLGLRTKRLKGIPCYRPILKDPTISDGAFRTLLLLKSKIQNGQVTVNQQSLGNERCLGLRTINRHVQELEKKRLLRVVPNSSRGQRDIATYILDDEFYAKYLAKKKPTPPHAKNGVTVPYGTIYTPKVSEDLPNLVPFPTTPVTYPKKPRKRQNSA